MFKTQSIDLVFKLKTSVDKKGATTMLIITKKVKTISDVVIQKSSIKTICV